MKKDPIDKLFKDKLRDYSETPDDKVWQHIERSLDKKKHSRKLIPIWWRLGGAAAVLALLIYLAAPLIRNEAGPDPITDRDAAPAARQHTDSTPASREPQSTESEFPVTAIPEKERPAGQEDTGRRASEIAFPAAGDQENSARRNGQTGIAARNPSAPAEREDDISPEARKLAREDNRVAGNQPENPSQIKSQDRESNRIESLDPDQPETSEVADALPKEHPEEKQSIFDAIAENEETLQGEENGAPRWSVGPRVAPVYFNSFGQGSPIHSSFVANTKSGNVNLSYGVALSYAVSPRLSIRSGVHKVDYGYDTEEISFSSTLARTTGQEISNIDYSLASRNLVVRNATEAKLVQQAFSAEVSAEFPSREGRMVQQFGYVEVPLELDFALIDKKLGVHLIGGLSSLFLIDNSVTLESEGNETEMGEANNLNSLNFSTNFGFGLDYQVSPRIRLNLEPVFKYQLNTFSDTSGDFNPYSIGVYSGLNFRF